MPDNYKKAQKNILRKSQNPKHLPHVKGYDFDQGVDYDKIFESYTNTGYQATFFSEAIDIIREMRKKKCTIFLGYTSNMVSSGLRDVFRYLAKHKMVDAIVTTTGGIEEDIIKCIEPFLLGRFDADGADLRKRGINRIGNIFVPNSRYGKFEDFLIPLMRKMADEQKQTGKILNPSEFIARLGKEINNEESIYYWTQKNNIPVFCPAITDGSIGDMIYFFKYERPDFRIDVTDDIRRINDMAMDAKKTGIIILGSGVVKHHICNANMFRNGAEYSVYINNSQEFDGSDAGARPDEAVSWGKISRSARSVKVFGDATILFPLVVAQTFAKKK